MLDIKYIRDHQEEIRQNIKKRNAKVDLGAVLEADEERRKIQARLDNLKAEQHKANDEIAASDPAKKQDKIMLMRKLAVEVKELEAIYRQKEEVFFQAMELVPNLTHPDVPVGLTDKDNKEIEKVGEIPKFTFSAKDHVVLGKELDLIDFDSAAEVTGQKFYYLKNEAALLEIALINYAINLLAGKGYAPIITPDLARAEILKGAGFNPRDNSDQIYNIKDTNLSLIATAEITIGGYYADHTLDNLPLKFVGVSHCFRKEAGSHGQESRGLYRVHQFTKVEMYIFCKPEESEAMHQELLNLEKEIFTKLGIPFRVVDVCTGDLGGPAYRKFDLEAWMPMKKGYGEITSTSNCTDFQARRLNIKYKDGTGKSRYVHTLNGTAIAISRALIAILENFQQADGSITIPEVLRPYMGDISVIKPRK